MLEVTPKNFRQVNGHTRTKAWQKSFMYELQQPRKRNRHRLLTNKTSKYPDKANFETLQRLFVTRSVVQGKGQARSETNTYVMKSYTGKALDLLFHDQ